MFRIKPAIASCVTFLSLTVCLLAIKITLININFIDLAICLLFISCLLDGVDGRIARQLKSTGDFGLALDSIIDFFAFGITPIFLYHSYFFKQEDLISWLLLTVFPICMAFRLARFNASYYKNPKEKSHFFFGVPAPCGALLYIFPIAISILLPERNICNKCLISYNFLISFLLVCKIPTISLKEIKLGFSSKNQRIGSLLAFILIGIFIYKPILTIAIVCFCYIATIPLTLIVSIYEKNKQKVAR
jgi:CDP-diacylglycerol--serine O-phosphatidyltransferase